MPGKMMRTVLRPGQQHDDAAIRAYELLALSYQAAASVLTKLGEADLAWIAAERGLTAMHVCDRRFVIGGHGAGRVRRRLILIMADSAVGRVWGSCDCPF